MLLFDFHEIGNNLYHFRKRLGLTQEEVAERANLSGRTYADMERGNVNIRTETLLRICQVLSITPDEVLTVKKTDTSPDESAIIDRLNACNPKDKDTALRILSVFLDSLE